jgi:hypothetical protein
MRSYTIEIKGIASLGMLKDNLPGRLWIGKLQQGQLGSILENLLNEALFKSESAIRACYFCSSANPILSITWTPPGTL